MSSATASQVHADLKAHERECIVRAEATQRQLDSLTGRIRRLEAIIMGSTVAVILGILTLMWKVLQLPV